MRKSITKEQLALPTDIDELDEIIESNDEGDVYACTDVYGNSGTVYVRRNGGDRGRRIAELRRAQFEELYGDPKQPKTQPAIMEDTGGEQ
jgi:hypothetical protein